MGNSPRKPQRKVAPPRALNGDRAAPRTPTANRLASGRRRRHPLQTNGSGLRGALVGTGNYVTPQPGDILFGSANVSLLSIHEDQLRRMRKDIELDPEGFLLDNLLLSVQFFRNYEQEVASLRKAAELREAPLVGLARRVVQPDALTAATGRHVRWRARHNLPDSLLAPQRHYVLSDNVHLINSLRARHVQPSSSAGTTTYNISVEAAGKPGYVKLRRIEEVDLEEEDDSHPSSPRLQCAGPHIAVSTPNIPAAAARGGAGWGSTPTLTQDLEEESEQGLESTPDISAVQWEFRPTGVGPARRTHGGSHSDIRSEEAKARVSLPEVSPAAPNPQWLSIPDIYVEARLAPGLSSDRHYPEASHWELTASTPDISQHSLDTGERHSPPGTSQQQIARRFESSKQRSKPERGGVPSPPDSAAKPTPQPVRQPLWASSQLTALLMDELRDHPLFKHNAPGPDGSTLSPESLSGRSRQSLIAPPLLVEPVQGPTSRTLPSRIIATRSASPRTKSNTLPSPATTPTTPSTSPRLEVTTTDSSSSSRGSASSTGKRGPSSVMSDKSSKASLSMSLSDLSGSSLLSRRSSPVPLEDFRMGLGVTPEDVDAIPEECFQTHMVVTTRQRPGIRVRGALENEEDDAPERKMIMHTYLGPGVYMASFADAFADILAATMGFPRESVAGATVRPGAILCEIASGAQVNQCEVAPGMHLKCWPTAAAEWVFRIRSEWPSAPVLRRVHELGAVVVPMPVLVGDSTSGSSRTTELQWGLAFPEAERLLELSMSATEAHGYLSLLALHRCFVEPACRHDAHVPGLSAAHIRTLYLWQCERAAASIPDPAPWLQFGRTLRANLAVLYTALQSRSLPDYFVSRRNLLAELPLNLLRRVQERVFRLREHLFVNVLQACRKLAYVEGGDFYPRPDYDRLATILSSKSQDSDKTAYAQGPVGVQPDWKANYLRQVEEERAAMAASKSNKASELTLRLGGATIDTKQRTINVLIFFCKHFSKMAESSAVFGAAEQSLQYLQHCNHLLTILKEDYGCERSAADILKDIRKAEATLLQMLQAVRSRHDYRQTSTSHDRNTVQHSTNRQNQRTDIYF